MTVARIRISSTNIQRDWRTIQDHLTRGDEVIVMHYRRPIALISPYQEEPVTTLAALADDLNTTIYVLMEFAPDDITSDMTGDTEVPADVESMIREAWASAPDEGR